MRNSLIIFLLFCSTNLFSQSIVLTGSLAQARTFHQAQLMTNGKVLVFGGEAVGGAALNSCELFDPGTGTWSSTGSMNTPRTRFGSMLLPNGNVLAIGGDSTGNFDEVLTCEIYDANSGIWSYSESMHHERYEFSAVTLNDGRLLIACGYPLLDTTEIYDPVTGHWALAGPTTVERPNGTFMVTLQNNKVLLGAGQDFSYGQTAELYDPSTDSWTSLGQMVFYHDCGSGMLLNNGKVLIIGSLGWEPKAAEIFDPVTNTFAIADSCLQIHGQTAMIKLNNGNPMVFGIGDIFNPGNTQCLEVYDVASNSWMSQIYTTTGVQNYTFTRVVGDKILIAGGNFTLSVTNTCAYITDLTQGIGQIKEDLISVFPNPLDDYLNINLKKDKIPGASNFCFELYNNAGNLILEQNLFEIENKILLPDFATGEYHYLLKNNSQIILTGNLVRVK